MPARFSGRQHKGAMRLHREVLRQEAEERNAKTPDHKRRVHREGTVQERRVRARLRTRRGL